MSRRTTLALPRGRSRRGRRGGRGSRISQLQRLQRIDEAGAKTVVAVTRREPFGAQGEEVGGALAEFGKPFRNLIKIGFVLRLTTAGIIFFYQQIANCSVTTHRRGGVRSGSAYAILAAPVDGFRRAVRLL